ncbi:sodium-dependent bicarbonate transport family permease [Thiomicrorhabdus sp. Kp2]|uniref:sodium-dependent bicarbonate transport family permease n=1 Tax=Thiomicrorhabdus sp. Kp2 TaxID=1123518 RepID=UPI0004152BA8|nr:sodium-dependent bicarbonate transport family permease [Thiomicrorhabdus sp. Kp2]
MLGLDSLLIPAVLFFALGVIATLIKSDLKFPEGMSKGISFYLLMAIGLKGGAELAHANLGVAVQAIFWAIVMGFLIPLIGYVLLRYKDRIDPFNAAAITAHYGSVSAATFLTAVAFLEASQIAHESYPIIMMVMMESPAIIVGLVLAAMARKRLASTSGDGSQLLDTPKMEWSPVLKEAFTNGSVILLLGAMVVGAVASPEAMEKVTPFSTEIFMGVLCLFLLDMGMEAAKRLKAFKNVGTTLVFFGVIMPLIGGTIGVFVGITLLNLTTGGALLVAILGASASYIAVPPAMRYGVPEANPSYYLTLALGVTFPFNVVVGIPLFYQLAMWYSAV